jgi:pilus assembly protein CpaE
MDQLLSPEPPVEVVAAPVLVGTPSTDLLAFVADQASADALRSGLFDALEDVQVQRGTILHAIRYLEKRPTPPALVVDVSGVANPLDELEQLARVCAPSSKVLVIGECADIAFYRDLVRVLGVAEYLPKPIARDAVARIFAPMLAGKSHVEAATRGGTVVAVCGTRGGVGATTVAVNLALHLAGTVRGHVALLDLHLTDGTAALQLGVQPGSGLRVALENPGRADALFLDRCSVKIDERLRLIAAQEPLDADIDATPEGMRRVLEELSRRFNYIVVDLPVRPGPAERQVLRMARQLLVVLTPEIAGVRDAERIRQWAQQSGCSAPVTFVVNRVGLPGGLKPALVRSQLAGGTMLAVPELGKPMLRAVNLGIPALRECAAFRRALLPLALEISGRAGRRPRASWLGRMLGR